MNINQIKKNKKNILIALALISTGVYLGSKYQIVTRHDVREIRDMITVLLQKGYIRLDGSTIHIVEKIL